MSEMMSKDQREQLLAALDALERERKLPKEKIIEAIEDALQKAYERNYGTNQQVIVELDRDTADLHIWLRKTVVPEVMDSNREIKLEDAEQLAPNVEVGMEIDIETTNENFGRIAAQSAKQVILQRMREFERDIIRDEFSDRRGKLMGGTVPRHERREITVDLGRAEGIIPPSEQAHSEFFHVGDRIKALVLEVKDGPHGPQIILSRSSPGLLKCLFETQVPEIEKGVVQIKAVVREAGLRSKIAVRSTDPNVDPVGACVGPKGSRVQGIVEELRNEKIDVIPWSDNIEEFIANALQPSRVTKVIPNKEQNNAVVIVPDQQLPLAIGREGQNARLAAKLTGWHIDIKSESSAAAEAAKKQAAEAAKQEGE